MSLILVVFQILRLNRQT